MYFETPQLKASQLKIVVYGVSDKQPWCFWDHIDSEFQGLAVLGRRFVLCFSLIRVRGAARGMTSDVRWLLGPMQRFFKYHHLLDYEPRPIWWWVEIVQ